MTWNDMSSSRIHKFRDRKNYHAIHLQSQKQHKQNENQTNKQINKRKIEFGCRRGVAEE